jgi:hypothetical protein
MNAFIDSNGILVSYGYAASNNADTLVEVPETFALTPGRWQYTNGEWVAYTTPVTPAESAAAAFAAGLAITSTGTPAINGTYACDPVSQADIVAIETSINAGKGFPGGVATFNYQDATGVMHSFTEANFTDLAGAIRDYVYALKSVVAGVSTALPAASTTIA